MTSDLRGATRRLSQTDATFNLLDQKLHLDQKLGLIAKGVIISHYLLDHFFFERAKKTLQGSLKTLEKVFHLFYFDIYVLQK